MLLVSNNKQLLGTEYLSYFFIIIIICLFFTTAKVTLLSNAIFDRLQKSENAAGIPHSIRSREKKRKKVKNDFGDGCRQCGSFEGG